MDIVLKRGVQWVELDSSLVTTDILRRSFRVNPSEVWLKSEADHKAYFPNDSGNFDLNGSDMYFGVVLSVEGPELPLHVGLNQPAMSVSSTAQTSSTGSSASYLAGNPPPAFKSVIPKTKGQTHTLRVVRAKMEWSRTGKVEFVTDTQMYLDITEQTANVEHIVQAVKDRWGDNYVIVTVDGLELEDSEGTKGLKFWKSPRRKLFAVRSSALKGRKRVKKRPSEVFSSDSENEQLISKHPKLIKMESSVDDMKEDVYRIELKIDTLKESIDSVKVCLEDILHLSTMSSIPIGLQKIIRDSFQCKICLCVPIRPPIIMSKCCKVIIGCETCVNEWYSGAAALTKTCPSCKTERGYSETMVLRGLDSFLDESKKVLHAAVEDNEN